MNRSPTSGSAALWAGLIATAFLLLVLGPSDLYRSTTPTGVDLPAHVHAVSELSDRLAAGAGPFGWDHSWLAGYPAYTFYFPLPALAAVVVGWATGLEVALRLVVALGVVAIPAATGFLMWRIGATRPVIAGSVGGATAFVLLGSNDYFGGNALSTLVGEFSYAWGMALAVVYVGLVAGWRTRPRGGSLAVAGVVLAAAVLSHVVPAAVAALATLVASRQRRHVLITWAIAAGLTAFWTLPLLAHLGRVATLPVQISYTLLAPFPREMWVAVAGLAVFAYWAQGIQKNPEIGRWLGSLAALALILWLVPLSAIGQARVLPFWLWAAPTALGAAVGLVLSSKSRRSQPRWLVRAGVGVVLLGLIGGWGLGSVVDLARLSLGGFEAQTQWPAYEELATALGDLEPGRVHWEDGEVWSEFGGGWTPAALPHFSEQATLGGLLAHGSPVGAHWLFTARQASSAPREAGLVDLPTEPTLDLEAAAVSMRKLGVRYYVAHSDRSLAGAVDAAELTEVATTSRFTIFEVAGHGLIAPAIEPPSVFSEGDWKDAAWDWFTGDDERWLVRSVVPEAVGSAVPVITLNRDEIVVDGAEPGVPYLIRVSYWPGWRVEGGDGPFEAAPSFMVVVPTQERFTLIYRPTAADYAGWGVSLLTAIGLLGGVAVGRRRREGSPPTAP